MLVEINALVAEGFMVPDEIREVRQMGWRCVMYGEHIDPLILEYRRKMRTPEGAREVMAKSETAGLNSSGVCSARHSIHPEILIRHSPH
ncbi:MAG: hypothetical protein NTNFB01_01910 [Nitrospira sp.]